MHPSPHRCLHVRKALLFGHLNTALSFCCSKQYLIRPLDVSIPLQPLVFERDIFLYRMLVVPSRFQPTSLHFVPMMKPHHGKPHALVGIRWIPMRSLKLQVLQRRSMGRSSCSQRVWEWGVAWYACWAIMVACLVLEVYSWLVNILGCSGCPH